MAYPSVITSLTNPQSSDKLNSPSHSAIHQSENTEITAIETFIGTLSSTAGTLIYDVRAAASNGGGHVQTANKGGTGQTSYTKGDVLVASSSSVLAKLSVGTDGQALIADSSVASGIKWGLPGIVPTTRVYTAGSVSIWNRPSTLTYAIIQVQAPGGAGASNNSNGAGGGGAGAFVQKTITAANLPVAASVLVQNFNTGSIISYFGSVLQVRGGTTAIDTNGGAAGSVLTAGDINYNGQTGTSSGGTLSGAAGGHSWIGKGGAQGSGDNGTTTAGNGQAGVWGGGGGGGSSASDGSPAGSGGNGGDGIIIVQEF